MKFSSNWLSEAGQTYKVPMLLLNKFSMKNEPHRTKPQHAVPSKPLFNCYHSSSQCSSSHSSLQQVMMSNLNLVWSLHARGLAGFRASCSKIINLKIVFMVMLVSLHKEKLCAVVLLTAAGRYMCTVSEKVNKYILFLGSAGTEMIWLQGQEIFAFQPCLNTDLNLMYSVSTDLGKQALQSHNIERFHTKD